MLKFSVCVGDRKRVKTVILLMGKIGLSLITSETGTSTVQSHHSEGSLLYNDDSDGPEY